MAKWREKIARFMYGRNGADTLYHATAWTCMLLLLVNVFLKSWIIPLLVLIGISWSTFRFFSRNIYRRQQENRAFVRFWSNIRKHFLLRRNQFRDRKTHVYRKCPGCKNQLRLPKVKGAHTVCCPCCKKRFSVKI